MTNKLKKTSKKNSKMRRRNEDIQPRIARGSQSGQPKLLKKRGVYVEKKRIEIPIKSMHQSSDVPLSDVVSSPPFQVRRPRKKRILPSVLSNLSESTIWSQGTNDTENPWKINKIKRKLKTRRKEKGTDEEWITSSNDLTLKSRYKSRILNDHIGIEIPSVVFLQSPKALEQTGSNNTNSKKVTQIDEYEPLTKILQRDDKILYLDECKSDNSVYYGVEEFSSEQLSTSTKSSKVALGLPVPKLYEKELLISDKSLNPSSEHFCRLQTVENVKGKERQWKQSQLSKEHKESLTSLDSSQHNKMNPSTKASIATKKKTSKKEQNVRKEVNKFYEALKAIAKNKKRCQKLEGDQSKRHRGILPSNSRRKQSSNCSNPKPRNRFRKLISKASYLSISPPPYPRAPISAVEYYATDVLMYNGNTETSVNINNYVLER